MQSLEIISVNLWQILISLCNLLILFLIIKKFLYKPVKKVLAQRQATLDEHYSKAEAAEARADANRQQWESKMEEAHQQADTILQDATANAELRKATILEETQEKAERILKQAEADAELERKKARAEIKKEIVDVSAALSEKMLEREIQLEDHRHMIDNFLSEMEDNHDGDE